MNREKFLSLVGLGFLSSVFLGAKNGEIAPLTTDCDDPITPPVPEGPFYKDEKMNRVDIREHKKGEEIQYIFKVEDKHCKPIVGAIVDIWQCDCVGVYSDFEVEKSAGETWLRGFQKTDEKGEAKFTSIFPGWYNNRLTHIHFKVHHNGETKLTSNLFFDKEVEAMVFKNPLYANGVNPVTMAQDYELRGDKDSSRHDKLIMKVGKQGGKLVGKYTVALAS